MWPALTEAFNQLSDDRTVRCILFRGAGKAFSPGADITEFADERSNAKAAAAYGAVMDAAYVAIEQCPHPIVARIHGPCTGAGLILALLADIRIAAASSKFGAPVARLGLTMPAPELRILQRSIGSARALDLLLDPRIIDANSAMSMGLVSRVVAEDSVCQVADDTISRIIASSTNVHRAHKAMARRLDEVTPLSAEEVEESYSSFDTRDYREGFSAFIEKRTPNFD